MPNPANSSMLSEDKNMSKTALVTQNDSKTKPFKDFDLFKMGMSFKN